MRKLLVFVVLLPSIVSPTRVVSWVWEDARGLDRERPTWGELRGPAGTLARKSNASWLSMVLAQQFGSIVYNRDRNIYLQMCLYKPLCGPTALTANYFDFT